MREETLRVPAGEVWLDGDVVLPDRPRGLVVFAHGSGSSRQSPRNREVATALHEQGLATLLFDLLTPEEETEDRRTARLRFDIGLLAYRIGDVVVWMRSQSWGEGCSLDGPVGLFGASTGAGAALVTAAHRPDDVAAVVSRGGRPDLAATNLEHVHSPTLFIVGGRDVEVLSFNESAAAQLRVEHEIALVPRAGHLFAEPGTLQTVSWLAVRWFLRHLES